MPLLTFLQNWDIREFLNSRPLSVVCIFSEGIQIHLVFAYFSMDKAQIFREMISHVENPVVFAMT